MKIEGKGLFFSDMKKIKVFDSKNVLIGHIGDLLLEEKSLAIKSLIIHGSYVEETLESLGIIDDVDPIVPLKLLERQEISESRIKLNVPLSKLKTTHTNWKPPENCWFYSKVKKTTIIDENDRTIGKIIDMIFHGDGSFSFVVGGSKFKEFLEIFNLSKYHEIVVPKKFCSSIKKDKIILSVPAHELPRETKIGLLQLIQKDFSSFEPSGDEIQGRYRYIVLETGLSNVIAALRRKYKKLSIAKKQLTFVKYNPESDKQTAEFVETFNEIAMTGVDPFEEMTSDIVRKNFAESSFLAYRYGETIGYLILTQKELEDEVIGAIAGIGIRHKGRGKGFASVMLEQAFEFFKSKGITTIQADVISTNKPSLRMFESIGFERVDDFYLA